ncbi:DUF4112 domain-containing protein [Hansschlegelia sp. KR7-227]|uniref:DUF4112 domain-containing protein n=1 Tax=Hansschlegelia sp. KR7-227 TaxID=3400914 RepID=UPI003BFE2D87
MTARAATGFAGRTPRADQAASLEQLDRLADMLDTRWRIPGTGWRFGVDAVAGLVPGVGDVATGLISAYMVKRAYDLGAPKHILVRMVGNVALDTVVGSVPVLGSVFDFAFKANRRNMKLLRRHFGAAR